ncbi:brevican core protein [Erpetoichthys calabaricus]|uniref:brevican core protein n=1 Tax=Erpetoichthys calabaricus TaxID=27687 RepID=UPI002234A5E1|nr:brevican core protein [Erpetoichthys calabaricus]
MIGKLILFWMCPAILGSFYNSELDADDTRNLNVKITANSPVMVSLASTLILPCHLISAFPGTNVFEGKRKVLSTPRVKWTVISEGREAEILVARGLRVKVSEAYKGRASLLQYPEDLNNLTLQLEMLEPSDSGIYRCEVQQGLEDSHDIAEVKVKGVVFHYRDASNRYAFTFSRAQQACSEIGASIATPDQLIAAYHSGYEQCDADWLGQIGYRYPIHNPRDGCYGDMDGFPGVRNYGVQDPEELYDVYCYVEDLGGEVFHSTSQDKLTFEEAKEYCAERGAELATTGQLYAAWNEGLDHCSPGWLADGSVRYPIVVPRERCGGNQAGVKTVYLHRNQTGFPEPSTHYDVFCFRGNDLSQGYTDSTLGYQATEPEHVDDVSPLKDVFEELNVALEQGEMEAKGSLDSFRLNKEMVAFQPTSIDGFTPDYSVSETSSGTSSPNLSAILSPEKLSLAHESSEPTSSADLDSHQLNHSESMPKKYKSPEIEDTVKDYVPLLGESSTVQSNVSVGNPKHYQPMPETNIASVNYTNLSSSSAGNPKHYQPMPETNAATETVSVKSKYSEGNPKHYQPMPETNIGPTTSTIQQEVSGESPHSYHPISAEINASLEVPHQTKIFGLNHQTYPPTAETNSTVRPLIISLNEKSETNLQTTDSLHPREGDEKSSGAKELEESRNEAPGSSSADVSGSILELSGYVPSGHSVTKDLTRLHEKVKTTTPLDNLEGTSPTVSSTEWPSEGSLQPTSSGSKENIPLIVVTSHTPFVEFTSSLSAKIKDTISGDLEREILETSTSQDQQSLYKANKEGSSDDEELGSLDFKSLPKFEGSSEKNVPEMHQVEKSLDTSEIGETFKTDVYSSQIGVGNEPSGQSGLHEPISTSGETTVYTVTTIMIPHMSGDGSGMTKSPLKVEFSGYPQEEKSELDISGSSTTLYTMTSFRELLKSTGTAKQEAAGEVSGFPIHESGSVSYHDGSASLFTEPPSGHKQISITRFPDELKTPSGKILPSVIPQESKTEESEYSGDHITTTDVPAAGSLDDLGKETFTVTDRSSAAPATTTGSLLWTFSTQPTTTTHISLQGPTTNLVTYQTVESPEDNLETETTTLSPTSPTIKSTTVTEFELTVQTEDLFEEATRHEEEEGTPSTLTEFTRKPTLPALPTERAVLGHGENLSDACLENPCKNGGTCVEVGASTKCLCLPSYGGDLCETDLEKCEVGWEKFQGFCYKHFIHRQSWELAEQHCRTSGSHLVSVMNPEEQEFINNNYKEYQWTGLNDKTIEGDFRWSDGNPLLYENWYHGQPDSYFLSGEDCVVMVWHDGGRWSDVPCNYHLSYTCKKGTSSCGQPPAVENAKILGTPRSQYETNSVTRYQCKEGFLQRQNPIIKCLSNGKWEEPQIVCVPANSSTEDKTPIVLQ